MSGYSPWNDDAEDGRDWRADDGSDDALDSEHGDDEGEPTIPCPGCGEEIHAEADACPHCGEYLLYHDAPLPQQQAWVMFGAILALIAMISGFALMAWAILVR